MFEGPLAEAVPSDGRRARSDRIRSLNAPNGYATRRQLVELTFETLVMYLFLSAQRSFGSEKDCLQSRLEFTVGILHVNVSLIEHCSDNPAGVRGAHTMLAVHSSGQRYETS